MGQSLYAIVAMMVVSLFAVHQQRNALRVQLNMIDSEVATVASGVAVERLEEIGALAFDQNTRGGTLVDSPGDLTPASEFGEGYDRPVDDLDDFNGSVKEILRPLGGVDTLRFDATTEVEYVRESDTSLASSVPTKYKRVKVTVTVKGAGMDRLYSSDGLAQRTVTLSQLFSCKSACQW